MKDKTTIVLELTPREAFLIYEAMDSIEIKAVTRAMTGTYPSPMWSLADTAGDIVEALSPLIEETK